MAAIVAALAGGMNCTVKSIVQHALEARLYRELGRVARPRTLVRLAFMTIIARGAWITALMHIRL